VQYRHSFIIKLLLSIYKLSLIDRTTHKLKLSIFVPKLCYRYLN